MPGADEPSPRVFSSESGLVAGGDNTQKAGRDAIGRDSWRLFGLVNIIRVGSRDRSTAPATTADPPGLVEPRALDQLRTTVPRAYAARSSGSGLSIGLKFAEALNAVPQRFMTYEPLPDESGHPLVAGTTLLDLFEAGNQHGRQRLLVLGAPGSGKTTSLQGLVKELAGMTDQPTIPAPIRISRWRVRNGKRGIWPERLVFWTRRPVDVMEHPMARWLSAQIENFYTVPASAVRQWIRDRLLILVLDGLDEIAEGAARESFVRSMNDFLRLCECPIVLSSRVVEYEALPTKIAFNEAIVIRPLDLDDVIEALDGAGESLQGLRTAIMTDEVLRDFCQSPLLLELLSVAYANVDATDIASEGAQSDRRSRMFDDYIERRLQHHDELTDVDPAPARRALVALALRLKRKSYTEFHLQDLRLDWLIPNAAAIFVAKYAVLWLISRSVGLSLSASLLFPVVVCIGWTASADRSWRRENLQVSVIGIVVVSFVAMAGGIMLRNSAFLSTRRIGPFDSAPWWLNILGLGVADGLCAGVLYSGIGVVDTIAPSSPYGVLRRLAWNGLAAGLVSGALTFAAGAVTLDLAHTADYVPSLVGYGYGNGLAYSAVLAIVVGLSVGMYLGLGALFDHMIVRFFLLLSPSAPVRYVQWLERMVERRLMLRAGDGYIFLHQLLLDHLAGPQREP